MPWRFLTCFFFILSLPVTTTMLLVSLALFVPTAQCPLSTVEPPAATLAQLGDDLERTGQVTITQGQFTRELRATVADRVEDLRVCFDDDRVNVSGKLKVGWFAPGLLRVDGVRPGGTARPHRYQPARRGSRHAAGLPRRPWRHRRSAPE